MYCDLWSSTYSCENYSRAENIRGNTVVSSLAEETIQVGKLFKGGNYIRKYGMYKLGQVGYGVFNSGVKNYLEF